MLNFNDTDISEGQAYKHHPVFTFGAFESQTISPKEPCICRLVPKNVEDVYEVWETMASIRLFYNDSEIAKEMYRTSDYYRFFGSLDEKAKDIQDLVKTYKVKEGDPLDIRVYLQKMRVFYYKSNGKMYRLPNDWYVNFKEAEEYFNIPSEKRMQMSMDGGIELDYNYANKTFENELIFSTQKSGFEFNPDDFEEMKRNILEEYNLQIKK